MERNESGCSGFREPVEEQRAEGKTVRCYEGNSGDEEADGASAEGVFVC